MTENEPRTYREIARSGRSIGAAAAVAGGLGAAAALLGGIEAFLHGYLVAFAFWTAVSVGCLSILMLHHLVAGTWGFVAQRILEAGASAIPLMALAYLPVLLGVEQLYPWTSEEVVAGSEVLQHKKPYLNLPFLVGRNVLYFGTWIGLIWLLRRYSRLGDETHAPEYTRRQRTVSAIGLIAHVLLMTWASTDWFMSLEPEWFSTIYPWLVTVSFALAGLAVAVLGLAILQRDGALGAVLEPKHFHDFGNLILAFVVLWTYMMFVQYLIMWSGNIPEDIHFYVHRREGGWFWVGPFMIFFHFVAPFFLLLSRRMKRSGTALAVLAGALLLVHLVFLTWLILPAFGSHRFVVFGSVVACFVGLGGLWLLVVARALGRNAILPTGDARFSIEQEAST